MARLDSRLESVGAEFLVLGQLLTRGIQSYKSYINHPGYDLIAVRPDTRKTVTIQVKSRWATDFNKSFPISSFDSDFVVLVALNRGVRYRKSKGAAPPREPDYFVFPTPLVRQARSQSGKWKVAKLYMMGDYNAYRNRWDLIAKAIGQHIIADKPEAL